MSIIKEIDLMLEMATRASPENFYAMIKKAYGAEKAKSLHWSDVVKVARDNDVTIPAYAHKNKVGKATFNLIPPGHADEKGTGKDEPKGLVTAKHVDAPVKKDDKPAPKAEPKSDGVTLADMRAEFARELKGNEDASGDDLYWQVTSHGGKVRVMWDYTFRRDTYVGAFNHNRRRIDAANARLEAVMKKYKSAVTSSDLASLQKAKDSVKWREQDGENAYSEYEQSLGSQVEFKETK